MKKCVLAIMLAGVLLSACTKEEAGSAPAETNSGVVENQTLPTEAPAAETSPATDIPVEPTPDEKPDEVKIEDFKEEIIHNDFFSADLIGFDLPENDDDMVSVIFEFTNITDKTYYKNDEEIVAGGTWEKTITYPRHKWADMIGESCWIHYDLYEDDKMRDQIFKGGVHFSVSEELQVTDLYTFED